MDIINQNQKQIEVQIKQLKPGVTKLRFKNFDDMGNYYESRMEEFKMRGVTIDTVGVVMFIYEKGSR